MRTTIAVGLFTVALAATAQANLIQIGESGAFSIPDYQTVGPLTRTYDSSQSGIIQDINVWLDIGSTYNGDLYVYLTHWDAANNPTTVTLLNRVGQVNPSDSGYGDDGFQILLDDAAAPDVHFYRAANPPPIYNVAGQLTGTWNPDGAAALSLFNNMDAFGRWTLTLDDRASGDVSQLNAWRLDITAREVPDSSLGGVFSYALLFGGMLWGAARARGSDRKN